MPRVTIGLLWPMNFCAVVMCTRSRLCELRYACCYRGCVVKRVHHKHWWGSFLQPNRCSRWYRCDHVDCCCFAVSCDGNHRVGQGDLRTNCYPVLGATGLVASTSTTVTLPTGALVCTVNGVATYTVYAPLVGGPLFIN
jgi:hypothetical protein